MKSAGTTRCPLCNTLIEDLQPEGEPHSGAWKASVVEPLVESGVRIGDTVASLAPGAGSTARLDQDEQFYTFDDSG